MITDEDAVNILDVSHAKEWTPEIKALYVPKVLCLLEEIMARERDALLREIQRKHDSRWEAWGLKPRFCKAPPETGGE